LASLQKKENSELHNSGLLFLLLSIIFTQGGRLPDNALSNYMQQFGFVRDSKDHRISPVFGSLEDYMMRSVKQGYLERFRCREEEGVGNCVWLWGPRAKSEIGKAGIERWIYHVLFQFSH
jgi:hypothetical protein